MRTGNGLPNDERIATAMRVAAPRPATVLKGLVLALALLTSCPAFAASFTCEKSAERVQQGELDKLEEVIVTGEKAATRARDLQEWLKLLVGQYTVEGYVDLCGQGKAEDQRPVTGEAECVGSGSTPNVRCQVNVRWPAARGEDGEPVLGGVSNLRPALIIYGLENRYLPDRQAYQLGLMFTQVDNKGVAEWASGTLFGDTFTSSEPCVDIPGACRKITRITTSPKSKEIDTQVDIQVDNRRVLRQSFVLHRQSNPADGRQATGSSP